MLPGEARAGRKANWRLGLLLAVPLVVFIAVVIGSEVSGPSTSDGSKMTDWPSSGAGVSRTRTAPEPFEQMSSAFEGNHSPAEIRSVLDGALNDYGLAATDENRSRAGSVLVTLRKEYGVPEMEILDYMVRSHVDGVNLSFPDAAAIATSAIVSGAE